MSRRTAKRRSVLRSAAGLAGLAAIGSLSGCQGDDGTDGSDGESGALSDVPAGSQVVVRADVDGILTDEQFQSFVEDLAGSGSPASEIDSVSTALDRLETRLGVDVREIDRVVAFGSVGDDRDPSGGAIVETSWAEEDLTSALDTADPGVRETSYGEVTVFESGRDPAAWLALLGEGAFAVGTESAVKDVVDRRNGDGDAVGGPVLEHYQASADDSYLRVAFEIPDAFRSEMADADGPAAALGEITGGHGAVRRGGDRELSVSLETTDEDAAESLRSELDAGRTLFQEQLESTGPSNPELQERLRTVVEESTIERSGATVTLTAPNGVEVGITVLAAVVASFFLGLGSQTRTTPTASFQFDYDASAEELEITHNAGDAIRASALHVVGEAGDADLGWWDRLGGSASGDVDGEPAVVAGDTVTLTGVPADYELSLVYRPADGSASATLMADEGPEA